MASGKRHSGAHQGILAIILVTNLIIGVAWHYSHVSSSNSSEFTSFTDRISGLDAIAQSIDLIETQYFGAETPNRHQLIESALTGMTDGLDDYSEYLDAPSMQAWDDNNQGQFRGIGVMLAQEKPDVEAGVVVIQEVFPDSPAAMAGLLAADRITAVNEKRVSECSFQEVLDRIGGKDENDGSPVRITFLRDGVDGEQTVEMHRDFVKVLSVTDKKILPEIQVGYVKIKEFNEHTGPELETVLKEFDTAHVRGLILDLQGNPGGLLVAGVDVCSFFLPKDTFVVCVEHRSSEIAENSQAATENTMFTNADSYRFPADIPVVILVDASSASCAEIVSASLKSHGRAIVLGEKTYGKGSVQDFFMLSNGGALKMTIGHYYVQPKDTPNRLHINGQGLTPDIEVEDTPENIARHKDLLAKLKDPSDLSRKEIETLLKDCDADFKRFNALSLDVAITYFKNIQQTAGEKQPGEKEN